MKEKGKQLGETDCYVKQCGNNSKRKRKRNEKEKEKKRLNLDRIL